jgi:hypothetical protein
MKNNKLGIESPCNGEMAELLTKELGRDTPEGWAKSVYKSTPCGAWIKVGCDYVELGSIVEGSDVEIDPITLNWPFYAEEFWQALEEINDEAEFYWERDNSEWFYVDFSPVGKPEQRFYGRYCWGSLEWADADIPQYVDGKVRQWLENVDGQWEYNRKTGIALGVNITMYENNATY